MANAEFLKKLGLKPHVRTAPAVPSNHVDEGAVAPTAPVRSTPVSEAGSQPAQAQAAQSKARLTFKIGGKPSSAPVVGVATASADSNGGAAAESGSAGLVQARGIAPSEQPVELPTSSPNAVPAVLAHDDSPTLESFQTLLDQFDAMVGSVGNITQLELDQSRNFVAKIMKDLVTHPELDGLIIDRDVHNVMKFVQASSGMANKNFVTSQERKLRSADRKKAAANVSLDAFDFGVDVAAQMAALKAKKGLPPAKPLQITDLSAISTDDIEAKSRR